MSTRTVLIVCALAMIAYILNSVESYDGPKWCPRSHRIWKDETDQCCSRGLGCLDWNSAQQRIAEERKDAEANPSRYCPKAYQMYNYDKDDCCAKSGQCITREAARMRMSGRKGSPWCPRQFPTWRDATDQCCNLKGCLDWRNSQRLLKQEKESAAKWADDVKRKKKQYADRKGRGIRAGNRFIQWMPKS